MQVPGFPIINAFDGWAIMGLISLFAGLILIAASTVMVITSILSKEK